MREIRSYGSEGGEPGICRAFLPLSDGLQTSTAGLKQTVLIFNVEVSESRIPLAQHTYYVLGRRDGAVE